MLGLIPCEPPNEKVDMSAAADAEGPGGLLKERKRNNSLT